MFLLLFGGLFLGPTFRNKFKKRPKVNRKNLSNVGCLVHGNLLIHFSVNLNLFIDNLPAAQLLLDCTATN